ncbi:glycosyltransferase family protein [Inediibacterium massiliense]|uniref:glycosyltransferase family protein n=1 Tax=Inediibacterium massiliense TaxID=1658111 RepID=UPI0006B64E83|nr:glycosyltransferase [Inediibacterium massiliense]
MNDLYSKFIKGKLKIGVILDPFSYECFKYEAYLIPLDPFSWKSILIQEKPDLIFVESAWEGNKGRWSYKIAHLEKIKNQSLKQLIYECKKRKIPTIFWNKEDPLFFSSFLETAKLFDYVFTTDQSCIPKYKELLGHNQVYILPFAAQPKIHNPVHKDKVRLGKVAFAGTWYSMFEDRIKNMEIILKPALKYNLHIYDRMYHSHANHAFKFPNLYQPFIHRNLSYDKMVEFYKKYDIFLNANIISDSPTMFSRRVFEILASGTNVISSYSIGIENFFKKIVPLCKTEQDVEKYLDLLIQNKEYRDRLSLLGLRKVLKYHTYEKRLETILQKIGIKTYKTDLGVSIITCTNRIDSIDPILDNFYRQNYKEKELIIVLNNNQMNLKDWKKKTKFDKKIKIFQINETKSLGECLNFGIAQSKYHYISKFDDDNYYAPHFLEDLMNGFLYTDAQVIGKHTYYCYLEKSNTLALRFSNLENRYTHFLCGAAFIMKKQVWNQIKFQDTTIQTVTYFWQDCVRKRIKLYASDRFNFIAIRHPSIEDHTWKIDDDEFLRKCEIQGKTKDYITPITV